MASVVVNGDTSGAVTLTAPAVAGTVTVTLPSTSGTMAVTGASQSFTDITATGNLTVNGNTTLGDASTDTVLMTGAPSIGGAGYGMGMGFRNRIINGAMVIDQRNAGASVTASTATYGVDRMQVYANVASKFTAQQNAGSVTPPSGFTNYLGITSSSAYSPAAGEVFILLHNIEGYNAADLGFGAAGASTVTLSFWVRSSLTGTFGGSLANETYNRCYPFSYTISSANTWEKKSITIAGDTSGTWATTNGAGIRLYLDLGCGSNYIGTAGAWTTTLYTTVAGATKVIGTNGATFYITGVQLEKGSTATAFDYRSWGTELALCQRYCVVYGGSGNYDIVGLGWGVAGTLTNIHTFFPVQMRTTPTFTYSGGWQNSDGLAATAITNLTLISASGSQKVCALEGVSASGITTYRPYRAEAANSSASRAIYSAEL